MAVLLGFGERAHVDAVFFQPTRDCVWVAPFVLCLAVNLRDLNSAELLFDILLVEPVSVLVERFVT